MKRGGWIRRRTWLRRGTTPLKRSPIKARGKRGSLFPHRRNPGYRRWIATLRCVVPGCTLPTECCHVRTKGAGGNDRGNCVPMDRGHHREQHRLGIPAFEARYGVNLTAVACELGRQYSQFEVAA